MAMTMTGEVDLPATKQVVWEALNDPEILKACIPGCQSLEKVGDNSLLAVAKVKVGPVAASFKGKGIACNSRGSCTRGAGALLVVR